MHFVILKTKTGQDLTVHPGQIVGATADGKKSAVYLTLAAHNSLGSDVAGGLYFDGPLWDFVNELNGE